MKGRLVASVRGGPGRSRPDSPTPRCGRPGALAIRVLCLVLAAGAASAQLPLDEVLDATLAVRALRGAEIGAVVVARGDGRMLYARNPDGGMVPASNQKLLTAIAALASFGPTHVLPIEVLADAAPDPRGAVETLYLRANGDPTLTSEDFWRLAADLRMAGVEHVRGELVVDDGAFDDQRWHPNWGAVSSRAYHAPVAAFSANYGAFAVEVQPGAAAGDPVRVRIDPPIAYLQLASRAVTGTRRSPTTLNVARTSAGDRELVEVTGSVPAGAESKTWYRSVVNPVAYAAEVLRMQLAANGIDVEGPTRRAAAPETAVPLLIFDGHPMSEIVRRCLKYSNNNIAESLVKALGARASGEPGSWKNGVPALKRALAAAGIPTDGMTIVDGSGLSYDDRVTPRQLASALRTADAAFGYGPELIAALPIAARDGTLEKRSTGAVDAVRAKTGLLTRVTALSGFAELADGTQVVFSLLVNGFRSSDERAMDAVDGFVAALGSASLGAAPAGP